MDTTVKKPLIVMLANAGHQPSDTRIFQKEAVTLVQRGFAVKLIIPAEKSFLDQGVEVIAVSLPQSGFQKLTKAPWLIFTAALRQPKKAWFHLHDSELLAVGLLLRLLGRKVIYDAHEDTPLQIAYQHWIPALLKKPYAWLYFVLEKMAGWFFNAIIVAEPVISRYYPAKKTHLVRNFPLLNSFQNYPLTPFTDRKQQLVYVGLLSEPRGFSVMLEASEMAATEINFRFVLGGKFSPAQLEEKIQGKKHVQFLSWVPYSSLVPLLFESKVGIIVAQPNERYLTNYPVKLFEYMAAGLPVIASAKGESAEFVRESQCGILVDPTNVLEVKNAIVTLLSNDSLAAAMGERGRKVVFEKYNWEREGERLVALYRSLTMQNS